MVLAMRPALVLIAAMSLASPLLQAPADAVSSLRLFGMSPLALRLLVAVVGALAGCLMFLWAAEVRGWMAGLCAAALLVSNHWWHVLGGVASIEIVLAAFFIAAMFCLFTDPWLETRSTLWGFAGAVAAGTLIGGIAGLLPLAVLVVYGVAAPRRYRPSVSQMALVAGLSLALAAPWVAYQLTLGHWHALQFATSQSTVSGETSLMTYAVHAVMSDPILVCLAVVTIPAAAGQFWRRDPATLQLFCWLAVAAAAVMGGQPRTAGYLLPLIPPLTILATAYTPFEGVSGWFLPFLVGLAFVIKAITSAAPWGLAFNLG